MLRVTGIAAAFAVLGAAQAAYAAEHEIVMLGDGYFPQVTYAQIGDTVRFFNVTTEPMAAVAADGSWTTGDVAAGAAVTITITDGMVGAFANMLVDQPEEQAMVADDQSATTDTTTTDSGTTETASTDGTATDATTDGGATDAGSTEVVAENNGQTRKLATGLIDTVNSAPLETASN
ncbi:hypothetical protein [Litorisediminicola beolgyonensis]|uniref:Plastocyanin n=1 Tax=Litorisediminicola beolgyonensis TaxID=1173614 RepID=A0ABW3ZDV0_9RHOB